MTKGSLLRKGASCFFLTTQNFFRFLTYYFKRRKESKVIFVKIPIDEQETNISFYRTDNRFEVYTSDTTMMTKLDKLVREDSSWRLEKIWTHQDDVIGKTYSAPKKCIIFFSNPRICNLTEEQKKECAERLRAWRLSHQKKETGLEALISAVLENSNDNEDE